MTRRKKNRFIQMAPHFSGFKPLGLLYKRKDAVIINFEEYEALKLCDYEHLSQAEAANLMNISRPTFTRIYESVRKKIAIAFIEASPIIFEGGNTEIAKWYKCDDCEIVFTLKNDSEAKCPLCGRLAVTLNKPEL